MHSPSLRSGPTARRTGRGVRPLARSAIASLLVASAIGGVGLRTSARATHAATPGGTAVTTAHNDTFRTGQNLSETILNTGNVNAAAFGKRVSYPVDGQVYAQPLVVPGVTFSDGSVHDVAYVATENDSVYAFDADATTDTAPLWHSSFADPAAGVTTVPSEDVYQKYANLDINPRLGITGTPVIDRETGTLYVVAFTKEDGRYVQRLHALDIASGAEREGSPVEIAASVPGSGYDAQDGRITFNPRTQNQRPGLLLSHGVVFIAWASFGDTDPYHGWVMGYDAATLRQVSAYNDTPDSTPDGQLGQEAGVWMSGAGLAADAAGSIFLVTGNGDFDPRPNGRNAGDSILRLSASDGLARADGFTPFNQACLDGRDDDLGSGGALLLPDQPGDHPHLLVASGKEGRLYLVDRDHMGGYTADPALTCGGDEEARTAIDRIVQELPGGTTGSLFGSAAYWQGTAESGPLVYIGGYGDVLRSFALSDGTLSGTPTAQGPDTYGFSGATPSISSDGAAPGTGVVWVISPASCDGPGCTPSGPSALRAYDATDVSRELYNSEENPDRDQVGSYVKFSVPTVANGRVFVGTQDSLDIFGLLAGGDETATPESVSQPTDTPVVGVTTATPAVGQTATAIDARTDIPSATATDTPAPAVTDTSVPEAAALSFAVHGVYRHGPDRGRRLSGRLDIAPVVPTGPRYSGTLTFADGTVLPVRARVEDFVIGLSAGPRIVGAGHQTRSGGFVGVFYGPKRGDVGTWRGSPLS